MEKVFFSILNELVDGCLSFLYQRFPDDFQIEGLFRALQNISSQNISSLPSHVENLCLQLVSFLEGISRHFTFQESEVKCFIFVVVANLKKKPDKTVWKSYNSHQFASSILLGVFFFVRNLN